MAKKKEISYTSAIEELEGIITDVESQSVDVDVLSEKVKRATYLIELCRGKLKSTDAEVKKVISGLDEEPETEDEPQEENDDEGLASDVEDDTHGELF